MQLAEKIARASGSQARLRWTGCTLRFITMSYLIVFMGITVRVLTGKQMNHYEAGRPSL